jgi:hypothetical protein
MSDELPSLRNAPDPSVATTAHHMAEAVTYLMRVARDAGLRAVATKLGNVRANLLSVALGPLENRRPPSAHNPAHDEPEDKPDAQRKPH